MILVHNVSRGQNTNSLMNPALGWAWVRVGGCAGSGLDLAIVCVCRVVDGCACGCFSGQRAPLSHSNLLGCVPVGPYRSGTYVCLVVRDERDEPGLPVEHGCICQFAPVWVLCRLQWSKRSKWMHWSNFIAPGDLDSCVSALFIDTPHR